MASDVSRRDPAIEKESVKDVFFSHVVKNLPVFKLDCMLSCCWWRNEKNML